MTDSDRLHDVEVKTASKSNITYRRLQYAGLSSFGRCLLAAGNDEAGFAAGFFRRPVKKWRPVARLFPALALNYDWKSD